MPSFISKLQYPTCEDGEYYDERERSIQETLVLINNYPWERYKHAEIDITCPSVTITDESGNWLKIGNYYGSQCVYYLDSKNCYYELYRITFDEVNKKVEDFFNGCLNLDSFAKSKIKGFGKKQYFSTKKFDYTVNVWRVFLFTAELSMVSIILLLITLAVAMTSVYQALVLMIIFLMSFAIPIYCFSKMFRYKGWHIHISKANNDFTFGRNNGENILYNKTEIVKITNTTSINNRQPVAIEFLEITFKDGESIKFPNILLTYTQLLKKLPSYLKPELIEKNVFILLYI